MVILTELEFLLAKVVVIAGIINMLCGIVTVHDTMVLSSSKRVITLTPSTPPSLCTRITLWRTWSVWMMDAQITTWRPTSPSQYVGVPRISSPWVDGQVVEGSIIWMLMAQLVVTVRARLEST